ncbi:hypothetical protein J8281_13950 [Aquimarina sp. U1-2]|uniref:RHS repeat-associated core domain-containing protein n=1 Tax=Aquimarina sp. U1-2 TaxID=2823141 RepID=UPI001AECCF18|nr:RHS repeat-associated core domain-containing protein [Aquimarina sp. U1-2]MBP2833293.1 hypothetical protein [Aquimarina sp. U1-2]
MPNRKTIREPYRYGYQGQEVDDETGKPAFELRLYDPRINRWLTPDPYGEYHSPYLSMGNNWISNVDPDGGCVSCLPSFETLQSIGDAAFFSSTGFFNSGTLLDEVAITDGFYLGNHIAPAISELSGWDNFTATIEANININDYRRVTYNDNWYWVDPYGRAVTNGMASPTTGIAPSPSSGAGSAKTIYTTIKQGTKAWKEAVKSIRDLKKANFRVATVQEAKALLKESFGNMNRVHRYKKLPSGSPQAAKRYEVHNLDKINSAREISVGNDLNHIKYINGKQSGHIYFGN